MKRIVILPGLLLSGLAAADDEPKIEAPVITAVEPASMVAGTKAPLKFRGFRLKETGELKFPSAPGVKSEIKEKKDAGQPAGLDNKEVGESQVLAELTIPADLRPGSLDYVLITPGGEIRGQITVVAADKAVEEKEPNDGFRTAQKWEPGKAVRGSIEKDKDVDVFEFTARAGQKLKVRAAGGSALLMDASLACYDARGQVLGVSDDAEGRDPVLEVTAQADGPVFLCVTDAHDKGGEWHTYLLTVEELP